VVWLRRRLVWVAPTTAVALVVALLAGGPSALAAPATPDPSLPDGASLTAPVQASGSAVLPGSVATESTQGQRGPGVPAAPQQSSPSFPLEVAKAARTAGDGGPAAAASAGPSGSGPGQSGAVENVAARTSHSTDFVNPDGSHTRRISADVAFAAAADGTMQPVDESLASRKADGRLIPAVSASKASFASTAADISVARVDLDGGVSIGFGLPGAPAVAATVNGSVVRYAGVAAQSDLELSATSTGWTDQLVLHSAAAPSSWLFPLQVSGATPQWDQTSGSVEFVTTAGAVVATIPPGYMTDSSFDPVQGQPARSNQVTYTLVAQGSSWALRVDLDRAWLADKARVWPVRVDPSLTSGATGDTFVSSTDYANRNNSAETELLVGTYNGGGEKSAAYLDFSGAMSGLTGKYIYTADVQMTNEWSYSCTPADVSIYAVTDPHWTVSSAMTWPGPTYDSSPLSAPQHVAYGYTSCPAAGIVDFPIDAARVNAWAQGLENFYGFTVRASDTDSTGWKRFWSNEHTGGGGPVLYLTYDNGPGYVTSVLPTPGGTVDTLTPTLFANYFDPNTAFRQFQYQVCMGTSSAPTGCHTGPWTTSSTAAVPPGWITGWGKPWFWQIRISNSYSISAWLSPFTSTTQIPQPGISAHLTGAPEGSPMPGVNPQPGNFGFTATDASVAAPGPALKLTRTYNSQDPRSDGWFGARWSTPWDQKVMLEPDGSGNVLVTLDTGLLLRFGENADATYSPPTGINLSLTHTSSPDTFVLRDATATKRTFTPNGAAGTYRVATVTDRNGLTQTFSYDGSGNLTQVTDTASGRALHVSTVNGKITSVATDAPAAGQPAPTWTYSYTAGALTGACTPLGSSSCTVYTNQDSSKYRTAVLDDNPTGYWPLDNSSGTTAANLAASSPGFLDGTETSLTLGAAGALTSSPDTAVTFATGTTRAVSIPPNTFNTTVGLAFECWFKTGTGQGGVLFSEQNSPLNTTPSDYMPIYVGSDGYLRGEFWTGSEALMTSPSRVDDSQWHHMVLSGNIDHQELYLDGAQIGTITSAYITHLDMVYGFIGNGHTNSAYYPGSPTANFPFTGQIDEAAFYSHPLDADRVGAHKAAGTSSSKKLTTITEPGSFTAATVTYDQATGRVTTLADRNGATWTLSAPTIASDGRHVTVSADTGASITYVYDTLHNGRQLSRTDTFGTTAWTYTNAGFVSTVTDENGNTSTYGYDATNPRGNPTTATTCRAAGDCQTSYAHYYLSSTDPLDPRNDAQDWTADARATTSTLGTYQTIKTLDAAGRVTQISYPIPNGQSVHPTDTFTYTTAGSGVPVGLVASWTGRKGAGAVTSYTYDSAGDVLTTTDPAGLVTTNTYDALGRVTSANRSATVGGSTVDYGTTTITYNALSQPVTVTAPAIINSLAAVTHQAVTTYSYDPAGRVKSQSIADAAGNDTTRATTWAYDPAGRLTATTKPDGTVTTQGWNSAGDLATTTLPGGLVENFTYDRDHRLLTTTATGAGVDPTDNTATSLLLESRDYDPAGRLADVADAMGRITHYAYYGNNLQQTVTAKSDPNTVVEVLEQDAYDAAGHPTSVTTAGGLLTTYAYDPAGNVTTRSFDPTGLNRATTTNYNLDSSIDHVTATGAASPGRTERVDYGYDNAGRVLTTTVDNTGGTPAALTTTLVRDPRGLVTRSTDPSGIATDTTYDVADQPVTITGGARTVWVNGSSTTGVRPVTTLGRDTFGEVTHQQDANGNTIVGAFDAMGRSTTITLPAYTPPGGSPITATTTTAYTAQGLPATVTDAAGGVTTYTYNIYGRPLTRTDPDPDGTGPKAAPVTGFAYDRDLELLDTTDPLGAHTKATYDTLGRQITSTQTDHIGSTVVNFTTTYGYDDAGNRITTTTPLNHTTTTTTFNTAGEPTKVKDSTGRFTQTSYDLAGRVVATVNGQGSFYANPVATTSYDLAGRATATSVCSADSSTGVCAAVLGTATTTFNGSGQRTQTMSAFGRPTYYGYDTGGQLTTVTQRVDPANSATAITVNLGYDSDGNNTRVVDGNGNATTYTYTSWNQAESTIEPSTAANPGLADRTWTTSYDALGQPVQDLLPGGVSRSRSYDHLGRLTTESGAGAESATAIRSLDYDADGQLITAASPAGTLTYTYDDRGLLATANGNGATSTYTYNSDSLLASRSDAAGTTTFTYDLGNRLTSIADPLTGATATTAYNSAGLPSSVSYGTGGPTRTYTYDNFGRIATDTLKRTDTTVAASTTYGYDTDNLLTTANTTGVAGAGTNTYNYDGLGRLTSWTSPASATTSYGYDAASNRTTVTTAAGTRTSTFDERNRLAATTGASQPAVAYTWTARGTLASTTGNSTTTSYAYDAFERLTQAAQSGGYTDTYTYDSFDRVAQRNGANFGYNDLTNNAVITPTATLTRDPAGKPVSNRVGAANTLVLADTRHEDVTATVDPGTGNLTASVSFDPFGNTTATTGTLPLGYQGGYTDPDTTLTNAHARWYDAATAIFTSRDTYTLAPDPTPQPNRYLYINDSPTSGTDTNGHFLCLALVEDPAAALICEVMEDTAEDGSVAVPAGEATSIADTLQRWGRRLAGEPDTFVLIPKPKTAPGQTSFPHRDPCVQAPWRSFCKDPDPTKPTPPPPPPCVGGGCPGETGGSGGLTTNDTGQSSDPGSRSGPTVRPKVQLGTVLDTLGMGDNSWPKGLPTKQDIEQRERDCLAGKKSSSPNYWTTDAEGRASGADACYGVGPVVPSLDNNYCRPKNMPPASSGYQQGHLIGKQIGGRGSAKGARGCTNITPISTSVNASMRENVEKKIARKESNETIFYMVVPLYDPGEAVPYAIVMVLISDQNKPSFYYYDNRPFGDMPGS
jgi:RHS repeat-associated protein